MVTGCCCCCCYQAQRDGEHKEPTLSLFSGNAAWEVEIHSRRAGVDVIASTIHQPDFM